MKSHPSGYNQTSYNGATSSQFPAGNLFELTSPGIYTTEDSMLRHSGYGLNAHLFIEDLGGPGVRHFEIEKIDKDEEGEIQGWWYKQVDGDLYILIIND